MKTKGIVFFLFFIFSLNSYASTKLDSLLIELQRAPIDSIERKANLLLNLGSEYIDDARFEKALEKHFESLKIFEKLKDKPKIAEIYSRIGAIYEQSYKHELALSYFEKAYEMEKEMGNVKRQGFVLGNIGVAYLSLGKHEIALEYFLKSKTQLEKIEGVDASISISNIGWVYYLLEKYDESILYYKKSINNSILYGNYSKHSITLNNIGLSFIKKNELDSAEVYILRSLEMSKTMNQSTDLLKALLAYSELLNLKKQYEKSVENLYQYIDLHDSIFSFKSGVAIQELQVKYETDRKEQEIILLKNKHELEKSKNQLLILGVILILIIGLFLVYRFYAKRKILIDRMELNKLKREKLKEEISVKSNQITNFELLTVEKNEFITSLSKHIKVLKREENIKANTKFKDLAIMINSYILQDKNRYLFENEMDEAYQNFFIKISEKYPDITQTEKKLAALLRLNLSSKEIGNLMNISPKTVDNYRSSLRKKLNINNNSTLISELSNI